jgi:hypothetical protein
MTDWDERMKGRLQAVERGLAELHGLFNILTLRLEELSAGLAPLVVEGGLATGRLREDEAARLRGRLSEMASMIASLPASRWREEPRLEGSLAAEPAEPGELEPWSEAKERSEA